MVVTTSRGDAWRAQGSPGKELPLSPHSQRSAAYQRFFFTLALLIKKHLEVSVAGIVGCTGNELGLAQLRLSHPGSSRGHCWTVTAQITEVGLSSAPAA